MQSPSQQDRSSRLIRWGRLALGLVACIIAFGATLLGVQRICDELGIENDLPTRIYRIARMERILGEIAVDAGANYDIAIFGDSTVYTPADRGAMTRHLRESLKQRELPLPPRIHLLAAPATGTFSMFFTATRLHEHPPDVAIIAFNPTTMSRAWLAGFAAPELSALISPSAMGRALLLPLHWIGLSVDELLLHSLILRVAGFDAWNAIEILRVRAKKAREKVESAWAGGANATAALGSYAQWMQRIIVPPRDGRPERSTRFGYERRLEPMLAGLDPNHPALVALRALIRELRRLDVPTLVYLVPANVEYIRTLGIDLEGEYARSRATIAATVIEADALFVDLHDSQPDRAFSDGGDHLIWRGRNLGTADLSRLLAGIIEQIADAQTASSPKSGAFERD